MKGRHIFTLFVIAFLLLIYWEETSGPKHFNWRTTYQAESTEPFGCKLFDEMMSRSMPKGYSVSSKDLQELASDTSIAGKSNILIIFEYSLLERYHTDRLDAIYQLLDKGSDIILAQNSFMPLCEEFEIKRTDWYWNSGMKDNLINFNYDTLEWCPNDSLYLRRSYLVKRPLSGNVMVVEDTGKWEKIILKNIHTPRYQYLPPDIDDEEYCEEEPPENDTTSSGDREEKERLKKHVTEHLEEYLEAYMEECAIFMRRKHGKGYLYLLSSPELLSNYSITHRNTAELALRIMNSLSDKPTVRSTAYLRPSQRQVSGQLSYIAKQSPLLWAYRLSLLAIVLFLITNAKRRQRVIPVMPEPVNHQLAFIKQIGTLYYQRGNHADMVIKKFKYLKERLRREVQIDISDPSADEESIPQLAALTGYSERHIKSVVSALRVLERQERPWVTLDEMTKYIDEINNIYNNIK